MRGPDPKNLLVLLPAAILLGCGGGTSEAKGPDPRTQPRIACPRREVIDSTTNDPSVHQGGEKKLHADAVAQLKEFHFQHQPDDCAQARVVAAQILRKGRESADEAWIVQSCDGECFEYRINVKPVGRAFGLQIRVPGG